MLLRLKPLILLSLIFSSSLNVSQAIADEICSNDIFGIKLGMTKEAVAKVMLEHGFSGTGIVSKRGTMLFGKDDTELWPPEGVEITEEQSHLMKFMQDPRRKAGIEKRAETDPKIKQLLTEIADLPPLPETKDKINIVVSLRATPSSNRTPLLKISVRGINFPMTITFPNIHIRTFHQRINR